MKTPISERNIAVWLIGGLVTNFVLSAVIFLGLTMITTRTPDNIRRALKATAPAQVLRLQDRGSTDSWSPMLTAYTQKLRDPHSDMYATFFIDRVKFQYPPSALLLFDLFPRSMINLEDLVRLTGPLKRSLDNLSRVALVATVLASAMIFTHALKRLSSHQPISRRQAAVSVGLFLAVGLTFYPLLVGYFIGQIQVFLNALLAIAVLCFMIGRPTPAGMCLGLCCLVKPQYALVLIWSLPKRQWALTAGLIGVLVIGLAVSIARFGLADHLRYVEVIRELSRVGETFWFNQSVNGLLNRLLGNGSPLLASPHVPSELPPFNPIVYALTMASSVAILAVAAYPSVDAPDGGLLGLLIMLIAVTMASPIAWNHHYGVLIAVFAAVTPALLLAQPLGRASVPVFAFSYITTSTLLVLPEVIFRNRWLGIVGSHLFFGSLALFGLLLALRAARWNLQTSAEQ